MDLGFEFLSDHSSMTACGFVALLQGELDGVDRKFHCWRASLVAEGYWHMTGAPSLKTKNFTGSHHREIRIDGEFLEMFRQGRGL